MKKTLLFAMLCSFGTTALFAGNDPVKNGDDGKDSQPENKLVHDDHEPEVVHNTFTGTRIINAHSIESIEKRKMDFRITHRFGDMAGDNGGPETLFGTDNAADIRIAFEYGITDAWDIGIGRNKGAGPLTQIFDGFTKYRILTQTTDGSMPISLSVMGALSYTAMPASTNLTSPSAFDGKGDPRRLSYASQLLIARKFGDRVSLQLMPTYVHRNFVAFGDENGLLSIGAASVVKVNKVMGLVVEYFHNLGEDRIVGGVEYTNHLGFGVQFDTGGHVFSLNITNSRGINETQFIPYTSSQYGEGQFRYGFTISRRFKI